MKINGHEVPIVDVVVGGSPCQDLSVAGQRGGLAGERSSLFLEQIRVIKEMREEVLDILKRIKIKTIHFAYDDYKQKDLIERKLRFVRENSTWSHRKIMVYILTNFDTTFEQDIERVEFMREVDFHPYVMIYDKEHCELKYRHLQRYCNPLIFWQLNNFSEYDNKKGRGKSRA